MIHNKSQSALEYLMTYGWAILIIVIVAAVLYSFGIFNPSPSASTTVTGFSGFELHATCINGNALLLSVANGLGIEVNITSVNVTTPSAVSRYNSSMVLNPQQSITLSVPGGCQSSNPRYSASATLVYLEPSSVFSGPYFSTGTIQGPTSTPLTLSNTVGGIAYTGDSGSCGMTYSDFKVLGLQEKVVAPLTCLYNGTCAISGGDSWTAYGNMYFGNNVTFSIYVDDNAEVFYRPAGSAGSWTGVNGAWIGDNAYCSSQGPGACGGPYVKSITPTPGLYQVAFASTYDHCGDGVWFQVRGAAFVSNNLNVSAIENGTVNIYSSVQANPIHPTGTIIDKSAEWPDSYYHYIS